MWGHAERSPQLPWKSAEAVPLDTKSTMKVQGTLCVKTRRVSESKEKENCAEYN